MTSVEGTVPGALPTKSNQRRLVRFGDRIASIKSAKAMSWLEVFRVVAATLHVPVPLGGKLKLTVRVTPENLRRDLDVELLCDALQSTGIIANDRLIWEKHIYRETPDKANPNVWFCVERIA